jgi:hypothetical protein
MTQSHDPIPEVVEGLNSLGYSGALVEADYRFTDWFSSRPDEWAVAVAAFGQTPVSYDSACIGVVRADGLRRESLVNKCRALGAPIILEVDGSEVREWSVSRKEDGHGLVDSYSTDRLTEMFIARAADWRPNHLLRLKNIGSYQWHQQLGLFVGLLPELEDKIQSNLDPLLKDALTKVRNSYVESSGREPNAEQIFKLIFWTLTAKVFFDRQVRSFAKLTGDSDELLAAVAKHYGTEVPRMLTRESRQIAADRIWHDFDFRNLSVEVLAQIWAGTLVDDDTKRRLSIHRTSRSIVRYIVERIPFDRTGEDKRVILEPCSGSAVFLIGAMNALRHKLFGADAPERHRYFVQHLAGIEADPFAVEISMLALTLADFPNPNGWDIVQGDVFDDALSQSYLERAGIVLCNPPYSDFTPEERKRYSAEYVQRPVAVMHQVLRHLHRQGVLGFVMPRIFVDGKGGYAAIREQLATRFASIEITLLPDRAFDADSEIALVVATDPIPHGTCRVVNRKVNDDQASWLQFEEMHQVSSEFAAELSVEDAKFSLLVPELPEVWDFLVNNPTLGEVAELHRGIEWKLPLTKDGKGTGHRSSLVRTTPADGYRLGVAPRAKFSVFEQPELRYLDFRPESQRGGAWQYAWERPKAIVNKSARSRGRWKVAAFPDTVGVACYQTFTAVWPKSDSFDEWTLSAILNSPVVNAFVATRAGKTDVTVEMLALAPVPHFTDAQRLALKSMIKKYQQVSSSMLLTEIHGEAEELLRQVDATVLAGYRMPPRIERELLDFFRGHPRPARHSFSEYLPEDCKVYFPLSEFISPSFSAASAGELLKRMREAEQTTRQA